MSKLFKTTNTPFQANNKIRVNVNDMSSIKFKSNDILFTGNTFEFANIIIN